MSDHALREQLNRVLDVWAGHYGRAQAKLRLLACLADYFGDEGEPTPSELELENCELRARIARLSVPSVQTTSLVDRVRTRSRALGAPADQADLYALESLVASGAKRSAEALARLLIDRAEEAGEPPVRLETTVRLDPFGEGSEEERAERSRQAQDRLFEAVSARVHSSGGDQ